jgi:hypothetical protein
VMRAALIQLRRPSMIVHFAIHADRMRYHAQRH